MMTTDEAAEIVWNYHLMGHEIGPADLIWALGSHDLRVADRVAELWHAGMAPWVVMSGGLGNFTEGVFEKPEAELFAERAIELGVPEEVILIENESTNTGENVMFTRRVLAEKSIGVSNLIAVQKPYMERRTFATICKQWEGLEVRVTSPQLTMDEYCRGFILREELIHIMVGDLQRILEYPARGFITRQDLGGEVMEAFNFLIDSGFRGHLL
ncbi:MAG: YdcF family protein [Verrucomicrobiales bacterium]|jgi:uncharacterized SAM-binding protein YcdF (DUF218 family)|nr:YdcF family protein [Akkermansiaceae bacterium]|tara:strand:- start:754 stop:1392 length:639 start_codon:yes stop_codon:yes gene_type:complete